MLKKIWSNAFTECPDLEEIYIPANVTIIDNTAFRNCKKLSKITVDETNTTYNSGSGSNAIISNNKLILGCVNTVIPDSVTSIGGYAFNGSNITSISLGDNITSIRQMAFQDCENLKSVTMKDSVVSIGRQVFTGCINLESITLSNGLSEIPQFAFSDCDKLMSITIPSKVSTIASSVFSYCSSLTEVIFENTEGWAICANASATSGDSINVENPSTNATNLTGTYRLKYWKRFA